MDVMSVASIQPANCQHILNKVYNISCGVLFLRKPSVVSSHGHVMLCGACVRSVHG